MSERTIRHSSVANATAERGEAGPVSERSEQTRGHRGGSFRVNVISDVHGAVEALAGVGAGADALVVLGDLLLLLDYDDPSHGIVAELFGVEAGERFAVLRGERRFAELRELGRSLWSDIHDPAGAVIAAARRQYAQLFAVLPTPAYLTYGNVDIPALWPDYLRPGHTALDGQTVEIGGWTFGFVGGWPREVPRSMLVAPFGSDVSLEEYAAKVAAVGEVDVLCCHVPPAVAELRYDVAVRNAEVASQAVLDAIRRTQPRYALFGHVHRPLQHRMRIGRTECVNVGHFRATGQPFRLVW